ncbi:MAG TPA: hypothetical protein VGF13_02365 [Verrucomicrobiae bacterium]|jgi:hypothetical protein
MHEASLSDLNYAQFSAVAGTTFAVSDGDQEPVPLKLVEVNQPRQRPADSTGCGESFSLLFAGPKNRFLPQRLYSFGHETMGRFPLFIVPVGQDATTFRYEAVFSRIPASAKTSAT